MAIRGSEQPTINLDSIPELAHIMSSQAHVYVLVDDDQMGALFTD